VTDARTRLEADLIDRIHTELGRNPLPSALGAWVTQRFTRVTELTRFLAEFEVQFQAAPDEAGRNAAILELSRRLGATARQLKGDAKALSRFFDRDAVVERVRRRVGEEERAIVFGLDRIGELGGAILEEAEAVAAVEEAWSYTRDSRLRQAGFRCLRTALERSPETELPAPLLLECQRAARQTAETSWIQAEALAILATAAPESAAEILRRRLSAPLDGDDIFVRRRAITLLTRATGLARVAPRLLEAICNDPSPAVRQQLAAELWSCDPALAQKLAEKLATDADPQVRAMLLLRATHLPELGRSLLIRAIGEEQDTFVLRTILHVIASWAESLPLVEAGDLRGLVTGPLQALRSDHADRKVRRWAANTGERLWCAAEPAARALKERVVAAIAAVDEGKITIVPGLDELASNDWELVGRVLAVLSQDDLGLELLGRDRLRRGELITFRSWRALHEWRNPASDKRQAFRHWIGRVYRGRLIAPSGIMGELAPTKVPGEPLFQPDEGDWRPWLPLLDMAISAVDTGEPVTIFSAEGMTELRSPARFIDRLRARLRLSWRFAPIAALRNWTESSGRPPTDYVEAIRACGVRVSMRPYPGLTLDPRPARFYSVGAPIFLVLGLWQEAKVYFSSLYVNSLLQLSLFLLCAVSWFFLHHLWRNRAMRRARAALAVSVGGWGTRGKSGTERLKAAVFSALGHPLVSKTTGNEAMFLHATAFGEVRELFLFRPYDKATIWEQLDLAVLSRKLGARVFLWECMGLTPSYVRVLQRHWMRDDIGTITNTYPDHEDVQGPAGRNIPEVMTNFIPEGTLLITSEEQMRPILAEEARKLGTEFACVGWLEAGLIPQEFLARFPYEEHPYNIALVTRMAAELGIEPDVAVKEMADRVVQDIGALKVYPEASVHSRRLEFILGNSANERFGALGNWTRLGFDRHDPVEEPDLWITTVVNNRADRVPRSRVFASILVKDISADCHMLIGSNLEGLQGFIREAWAEFAPSLTLTPPDQTNPNPAAELESLAKRFRAVHREDQLQAILAILERSGHSAEESALAYVDRCREQLASYRELEADLEAKGPSPALDNRLRETLWNWFQQKIVVVEDYYATGEAIVRQLADLTPPGFRNRIMGLQNIKGTGLDFVYRWHAWEAVERACRDAESHEFVRRDRGLAALASFKEFGILSQERVSDLVAKLRSDPATSGELTQNQLTLIDTHLREQLAAQDRLGGGQTSSGGKWMEWLEAVLDAGDAVKRRKAADLIYREMAAERISTERAVSELKALTSRQKGGWLKKDLRERSWTD
jgi:poly-gamma-glutamate synthase PgsB/CapB